MKKLAIAVCACALSTAQADAATYLFSFDAVGGTTGDFSFSLDSSPMPDDVQAQNFTIFDVSTNASTIFGPTVETRDYTFYTLADFGGFGDGFDSYFGAQLFTGSTAMPTFVTGSYTLTSFDGGPVAGVLTITGPAAPVPEPATWLMMIAGFGIVGGALRRGAPVTSPLARA